MNWDIVEGNWKKFKGNVKQQWGKLTDDHLDQIAGKRDQLIGKLQETYGLNKDEAEKQIKAFEERNSDLNPPRKPHYYRGTSPSAQIGLGTPLPLVSRRRLALADGVDTPSRNRYEVIRRTNASSGRFSFRVFTASSSNFCFPRNIYTQYQPRQEN